MRRIALLLAAMLAVYSMNAQKDNKQENVANIDNVNYRITYTSKMVPDTTKVPYTYWEGEAHLDIGSKATHFYGGKFHWEFYKNYPAAGQTTLLDRVLGNYYQCTEKVETPSWQIIPDSTATLMDYKCQLATAFFKGRLWYAWYTEDIPLNEGPWKLYGLPGLVLRAYDRNKQYVFDAIGMTTMNGSADITFTKKEREEVTQKELRDAKRKFDGAEALRATERKTGIAFDKLPEGAIKALNRSNKGNPIELE